jgi:hypothetical protein
MEDQKSKTQCKPTYTYTQLQCLTPLSIVTNWADDEQDEDGSDDGEIGIQSSSANNKQQQYYHPQPN